jgi:hypothetical protein
MVLRPAASLVGWQLLSRLEHAAGQVTAQSLSDFLAELLVCHGVSALAG